MSEDGIYAALAAAMGQSDNVEVLHPMAWVVFTHTKDITTQTRRVEKRFQVRMFKFQSAQGPVIHDKVLDMVFGRDGWMIGRVIREQQKPMMGAGENFFKEEVVAYIQGMQIEQARKRRKNAG
jgi:hypothetical protein